MNVINFPMGLGGRYKLRVGKGDTVRVETPWFDNIITDAGLELIGTVSATSATGGRECLRYIQVGSGNATPSVGDTGLETFIGSKQSLQASISTQGSPPYYGSKVVSCRFNPGEATGNISEVGVGIGPDSDDTLFSRALVVDMGGSPTTITVLADEWLDVTYELRCYPPLTDVTGTVNISGDSYDIVIRASEVTVTLGWATYVGSMAGANWGQPNAIAYTGDLGTITQTPAGTIVTAGTVSLVNIAYSALSLEKDMEATFGLTTVGDIKSVKFQTNYGYYQMSFDPVIEKDATQVLSLVFRIAWARKTL